LFKSGLTKYIEKEGNIGRSEVAREGKEQE